MIVTQEITDVQTSGIGETSRATIKASARLFSFFSDMIYADKFVAIWRELVANGMDAMVAAGTQQQQMIVTLPTDFTPYAKVRDFGTGMSHEFLMGKFMAYTDASTKENSNDFIGGFGIGSKAPLSYTEQFAIHSYQNGSVGIYSIFKDDTGCPSIAFLGRHESVEPDGIEISFPVEGKDIKSFREAAMRTLNYFQPLPLLVNSEQQLFAPEYTVRTATWGFLKNSQTSRVVQGGIAYPIDTGQCKEIDELLSFGIDFYVPIGSCSIALSRETLAYDERTLRLLRSLADSIRPDLQQHVSAMFTNCKTKWEAEKLYGTECMGYGPRQKLIQAHATYKGVKLTGRFAVSDWNKKLLAAFVTSSKYDKHNYSMWSEALAAPTARAWLHDMFPKDIQMVLIDDGPKKPVLRMRRWLEENSTQNEGVVLFRPQIGQEISAREWGEFLISIGRPPFKKLSEIEPAVVVRAAGTAREQKVRAYLSPGNFRVPGPGAKYIDTLPSAGGYYMQMNGFVPVEGQATQAQLIASGLTGEQVHWFNKGDFEQFKKNPLWKPALEKFNEKMAMYKAEHRNMALAEAFNQLIRERYTANRSALAVDLIKVPGFNIPKQGPLYQISKMYALIETELTDADRNMRELLVVDYTKQMAQLKLLISEIQTRYPELWKLAQHRGQGVSSDLVTVYNKLL